MCDTSEKICIGFIGLGLIGGSIAKTLRKVHPEYKLWPTAAPKRRSKRQFRKA